MTRPSSEPEELIDIMRREALAAVERVAKTLRIDEGRAGQSGSPTFRLVCQAYAARRERRHFFGPDLFSDPAWDILLVMYCAHLGGEQLTVTSAARGADVPYSTGLRWLKMLEDEGLVVRMPHPTDRRSAILSLTEAALTKLDGYVRRLRSKGLMRLV